VEIPTPLPPSFPLPSGIAVGEVGSSHALVWSRCDREAVLHVRLERGEWSEHQAVRVTQEHDFAAQLAFDGLAAASDFEVAAWCTAAGDGTETPRPGAVLGKLRTAPANDAGAAVRFAWGGDLGGQNVCRDARFGYPITEPLRAGNYDFFIGLGDMIYADTPCAAVGLWGNAQVPRSVAVATTLPEFQACWRYNRDDAGYRALLAETPYFGTWDDHEVVNDFGPSRDRRGKSHRGEPLIPAALQAMRDYNPLPLDGLVRQRRWGKHVELFFVDTRSFRDENTRVDAARAAKQMLGSQQIAWLLDALSGSDATWKFVIASVPLSIPTGLHGGARDGFANYDGQTGFERELVGLLSAMREQHLNHTVWLTTDVHMAAGFEYRPFPESPDFVVHEFISGPLSAGFFPRDVYDKTLRPKRHFAWPVREVNRVKDYEGALTLFNYGEVSVSSAGALRVDIVNALGERVHGVEVSKGR
jgi:alkaline phosphatase D